MPNFEDIKKIMSKVKAGFVKARKLTEEGINNITRELYNYSPEKKYKFPSNEFSLFQSILVELCKAVQNSFRLAEEGYYRSAFGELGDILEVI